MDILPPDLAMGAVSLRVADRDLMLAYYQGVIGLDVLYEEGNRVVLGRGSTPVLELDHQPALKHAGPREAGLFHTAFLFNTASELATTVWRVVQAHPTSFTGSADHLVSEAFYFDDPEGNGVELYVDRPRSQWDWVGSSVRMATLPLDPNAYLEQHLREVDPVASHIGHVHLCVGDLDQAKDFYVDTLGFETTLHIPQQALFVSAGGYHHHMAMNVWRSRGAGRRNQTLGLGNVRIELPTQDAVGAVRTRLLDKGVSAHDDGHSLVFEDPWANQVTIAVAPPE